MQSLIGVQGGSSGENRRLRSVVARQVGEKIQDSLKVGLDQLPLNRNTRGVWLDR